MPELPKVPFVRIPKPFRIRKPFNTIHLQKQICGKIQAEQKDKIAKRAISKAKKHDDLLTMLDYAQMFGYRILSSLYIVIGIILIIVALV